MTAFDLTSAKGKNLRPIKKSRTGRNLTEFNDDINASITSDKIEQEKDDAEVKSTPDME